MDGEWSPWALLGVCDANGKQQRTRSCTKPAPLNGGKPCSGSDKDEVSCPGKTDHLFHRYLIKYWFQWMESGVLGVHMESAVQMERSKEQDLAQSQHH